MDYTHHYSSPLGGITLASNGEQITGLWFDGQKYFGSTLAKEALPKKLPIFDQAGNWLDIYFHGMAPDFTPPLSLDGTPFRKAIWGILRAIPYGETITYGEIAQKIARKKGIPSMSPQAVGNAIAHNPVSLIIPCHRVVGSNKSLTGYAGGIDKKAKLLSLEKIGMQKKEQPKSSASLTEGLIYEILSAVAEVPKGKVASYGQIARLIGRDKNARLVGKVLSMAEYYGDFPCHRIVNHAGRLAPRFHRQRELLLQEHVEFKANGCVDMEKYQWDY